MTVQVTKQGNGLETHNSTTVNLADGPTIKEVCDAQYTRIAPGQTNVFKDCDLHEVSLSCIRGFCSGQQSESFCIVSNVSVRKRIASFRKSSEKVNIFGQLIKTRIILNKQGPKILWALKKVHKSETLFRNLTLRKFISNFFATFLQLSRFPFTNQTS
ncbi:MAG: hypothetical protein HRT44_09225 [Bdellovibrionales bacterium]|nr:hypothetical protein [Bdellovibrionales bacterium]NQZ19420.1 hypothetical protein [Bdellovibrionales bacterium]